MSDAQPQLYFREFGTPDSSPLVMIHGLYGDSTSMAPLAELLADRFHVIAVDALGHGRSPRPEAFSLEDQGRAVNALIESLGYESVALVGVSMGSYIAAQAAILDPSRISRLVLVVPKAHGTTSSVVGYAQRHGFDLAAATIEETVAFMDGAMWSPDTTPSRRAEILSARPADATLLTPAERSVVDRSLEGFDLRPDLWRISAPTLVISGLSDGLNPPEFGREVADLIERSRFEVYEHSGHMLVNEETDRLVDDVTAAVSA